MVKDKKKHIWLNAYPEDVPAEIGPLQHSSIGAFFEDAFEKTATAPAHTCMGKSISYKEWDERSAAMASWLHSLGLQDGARVAIMLPNILQTPILIAAVLRAGFTLTCINPLYTPREVKNQLVDSGAEAIIILENFAHTLEKALSDTSIKHICITKMGDMFHGQALGLKSFIVNSVVKHIKKMVPDYSLPSAVSYIKALEIGAGRPYTAFKRGHGDIAVLQYTGGTTGVPKAAMISHANILSNAEQCAVWIDSGVKGKVMPEQLTFLCALPLFHIFSFTVNLMIATRIGGHNLLIPNPRDIPALVKDLSKHNVQIFGGLNTLFNALLNNDDFRKLDFSHDMITASGGMKTQTAVANRWRTITGSSIKECYGLTETSPVVCGNRYDLDEFTGTIGIPIPSTIVEIRSEKNKALKPGEIGEICISGPQVMLGYWNNPEETKKTMTKDGMLKTGDMGFMDKNGLITIVDRLKDMILVSGFNVYPNEIEDVVAMLDGVVECAAVGISNKDGNDDIKLFVVKNDELLTADDIRAHCKRELTNYKRPKFIVFHDDLPKTNVGKILRRELRNI